jgi:hypothetical protein
METSGNIEYLKAEIKKAFSGEFEEYKKNSLKEFNDEKEKLMVLHNAELKRIKQELEKDKKNAFKAALSDEKLGAKREFENKREELINRVFERAQEESEEILLNKKYINFVKEFVNDNKDCQLIGGYEQYKKNFNEIDIQSGVSGIIAKGENYQMDFTYKIFIETRKLELRHKASKILFEE